ncbi:TDP-N-acetylfucosamine:lipid II N-acetylfucosaminyltransferase [Psychrobacter sanguinis]|uniref:TDP-N-acetylfucosamine:lipid II N-acetylfucosaminyltransferase n=1 Tax=Psychrobacter sanguinis TaxID=861445 RepID=A0A844LZW4_9GAMM|nr:TDP-N-acetylfucosamine:lipid II N-acetylfucosaminyltransferase [Psychrobacter sanguinis]MUG31817.1 TDP-N-acetylfucosamine:lipid II N-acetylfucosaminyltransferase [Psychrobacter sanguinis]
MSKKILHVGICDKFIPPFIKLVKESFGSESHEFMLSKGGFENELKSSHNIKLIGRSNLARRQFYLQVILKMHLADKIILHGLFDKKIVKILFYFPWLLKKCYWVMWGADLYTYENQEKNKSWRKKEFLRRPVIKNMGHLVTYIPGDVGLARKWYGAKGEYHECLMYLSNTYKALDAPSIQSDTVNIQIGNSADPSNNHFEILAKLLPFRNQNIKIYAPLSYGDQVHAKKVIAKGKELFGNKFIALTELMPFEQYLQFLGSIDIAIFNHERQQAMGNTITLLGLGKTVFIRSDTTQWQFFKDKEINVYDIKTLAEIDLTKIKINKHNMKAIKSYFSIETLKSQLEELFI